MSYTLGNGNRLASWSVTGDIEGRIDVQGHSSETIGTNEYLGQLLVSNLTAQTPQVDGTNFWAYGLAVGAGTQDVVVAIGDGAGNVDYATNTITITVVTNASYALNAAGCVTNISYLGSGGYSSSLDLTWNGKYQLVSVATNDATAEAYEHDALGRRTKVLGGSTTNYLVYDGDRVIGETDSEGTLLKSYTWGPGVDNLLAFADYTGGETNTYYTLTDHLGTVHALADAGGAIVESYRFDAWGRVIGVYDGDGTPLDETAVGNNYLWQGRWYSWSTGLYNFRARWYDPITGRWLSKDPIGIAGGLNQYQAFANNPVNVRDPDGEVGKWVIAAFAGATSGAGAGYTDAVLRLESSARKRTFIGMVSGAVGGAFGGIVDIPGVGGGLGAVITLRLYSYFMKECVSKDDYVGAFLIGGAADGVGSLVGWAYGDWRITGDLAGGFAAGSGVILHGLSKVMVPE